jgi:hypothetical protein
MALLTVHCPARDHFVDLSSREIETVELRGSRIVLRWRCPCGHRGISMTRAAPGPVDPCPDPAAARPVAA